MDMASTPDRDAVLNALRVVVDPDIRKDIVSLGFVKDLTVADARVSFTIELTTPACPVKDQLRDQAVAAVSALPGVHDVEVRLTARVRLFVLADPSRGAGQVAGIAALRDRQTTSLARVAGAKIFLDGVLEGGTAALLEPYLDRPGWRGEPNLPLNRTPGIAQRRSRFGKRADVCRERAIGCSRQHHLVVDDVLHGGLLSPAQGCQGVTTMSLQLRARAVKTSPAWPDKT